MTVFWILLAALLAVMAYPLLRTYVRYRGTRIVRCPQSGAAAEIDLDAVYAAVSRASSGYPMLRVAHCSRWPRHHDCDQECVGQIDRS